ncbi:MAG: TrmH family RNA methyltransferase [Saprospiraceae bacterium]|nr:TrmH family RNA methyltransferase [Saprospiraceae bacterium]
MHTEKGEKSESLKFQKKQPADFIRLTPEAFVLSEKHPIVLCADNIRSGHNIGSLFRIADAFSLESILLGPQCASPPHPEILKTSLGAHQHVPWVKTERMIESLLQLKSRGYALIGIEQTKESVSLECFVPHMEAKYAFVFGHEVHGIGQEILDCLDTCLEIPQSGVKHSINVSVAAGIVVWHALFANHKAP